MPHFVAQEPPTDNMEMMKTALLTKRKWGAAFGSWRWRSHFSKNNSYAIRVWTTDVYLESDCVYSNRLPKMQK